MDHALRPWALALALLLPAAGTQAASLDAFATGLSGWTATGDVAATGGAAWLTTASTAFQDDFPELAGSFNLSGTAAVSVGGPPDLESALGLAAGALDPDPGAAIAAFEGSGLRRTFAAAAGDTLSFDWRFLSNDAGRLDYAFALLDGELIRLATATEGSLVAGASASPFAAATASATFSRTLSAAGTHTLAFGVVDVEDAEVTSALRVASVQVTPIPEPETWFQLVAGLSLLGLVARRRRRRATSVQITLHPKESA